MLDKTLCAEWSSRMRVRDSALCAVCVLVFSWKGRLCMMGWGARFQRNVNNVWAYTRTVALWAVSGIA